MNFNPKNAVERTILKLLLTVLVLAVARFSSLLVLMSAPEVIRDGLVTYMMVVIGLATLAILAFVWFRIEVADD